MRVVLLTAALGMMGCVPFEQQAVDGPRFDFLTNRDLVGLEHRVALEAQTGETDDWTDITNAWIRLVECEPIGLKVASTSRPRLHLSLLRFEEARRLDLIQAGGWGATSGTIFGSFNNPGAWKRTPDTGVEGIRWVHTDEKWGDEQPEPRRIHGKCDELQRLTAEESLELLRSRAVEVRDFAASSDLSDHERLAVHRVGIWLAYRSLELNGAVDADLEAWLQRQDLPGVADYSDRGPAYLLKAMISQDDRVKWQNAERAVREFREDDPQRWYALYILLRMSSERRSWVEATELVQTLPPKEHPVYTAFAWRISVASRRANQPEAFLRLAIEAFRDRGRSADPFMEALYREVLNELSEYPFDARVSEIIEELGPRAQTFKRLEDFARVCLDRGRPENARALAQLLIARHSDARAHARYHGILAMASFLLDDARTFQKHVRDISRRDPSVMAAIPTGRRATFFAGPDEEFARILRQTLPMMAEWGESKDAQRQRQRWLKVIVEEAQAFLRQSDESLSRPQLVELYRVASSLLEEHPRGYAERIGASTQTLVIGTVVVDVPNLDPYEPPMRVRIAPAYSMLLIPQDSITPENWQLARAEEKP